QQAAPSPPALAEETALPPAAETAQTPLHQCRQCGTVYDETYGDPAQQVAAGTPFGALTSYQCPTCEAPLAHFVAVRTPQLLGLGTAAAY
ncbi:MAG: hypothetical protein EOO36_14440, partial [Cytophagaceae bacterium]